MPDKSPETLAEIAGELGPLPVARFKVPLRLRAIAALQALGGLLGVYVLLADASQSAFDVFSGALLLVFGCAGWLAFGVWRGDAKAVQRMQWLLAAQVPWLNLAKANLHYDFYFLVECTVRLGSANEPLELGVGTSFNAYLGATEDTAYFGVNLAAVALFLMFRSAREAWLQRPRDSTS
ncbi:MAG: hypothetical protein ABUL60_24555 [Myxococcales bacterium]